ncbi:NAD(P)H-hydrate dehydratase [Marinomonas pollencensis]|uniref:Bifunctional NAD(P)H-hydrate repair enzyme n=1 Tax=Marinomonas pollencensis TaxID=491954 RepID=A0A3E0DHQ8_9GAMM|nr:NAD(P)H-hydrate dehydratase [Marinomonas pollencensis]REG81622.1 NAD(P)H-hydrate epimerase [Marinomonas pollencensis]
MRHIGAFSTQPVFNVASIRQIEKALFSFEGNSFTVMERAAQALFKHIVTKWPDAQHFVILAGAGNNGGDGLLLAVLLKQAGLQVLVLDCAHSPRSGDALRAFEAAQRAKVNVELFSIEQVCSAAVVVDGVLGIGARLPLREDLQCVVHWINQTKHKGAAVVAIDLPTGVDADTGYAQQCVEADLTISMVQLKIGNLLGRGGIAAGQLINDSLGSQSIMAEMSLAGGQLHWLDVRQFVKQKPCPRYLDSHKGSYGHVAVVGGDHGYGGAALMASEAASKTGAGTVALLTRWEHVTASLVRNPNVMAFDAQQEQVLSLGIRNHCVLVLGPGLGRARWGQQLFTQMMALSLPTVLDADGLFWLSQDSEVELPIGSVITPHLGEAARLLGWQIEQVNRSPIKAALLLARRYRCVVVLKGVTTLVVNERGDVYMAGKSEPVLSKGGSGDVLSGMLGATLAYYKDTLEAALMAVSWHNYAAGEMAVHKGVHCGQPYDVLDYLD